MKFEIDITEAEIKGSIEQRANEYAREVLNKRLFECYIDNAIRNRVADLIDAVVEAILTEKIDCGEVDLEKMASRAVYLFMRERKAKDKASNATQKATRKKSSDVKK